MMSAEVYSPDYATKEALTTAHEIAAGFLQVTRNIGARDFTPDLHQERAIEVIGQSLAAGSHEGHLKMATGSGKSLLISMLTEAAVLSGKRVLILAPRTAICDQLVGKDGSRGLGKFSALITNDQVSQQYGGLIGDSSKPVVVSTYAGFLNEYKIGGTTLGEFDLIIGDECHRSLGPATSKAMKEYMPGAVKLGFSATPDFADDRKSEEVFGKLLFDYPLRTAIEDGTSAPIRALLLETGQSLKLTDNQKDFTERELAPLARMDSRNATAAQLVKDLVASGRQGIISCIPGGGNAHARVMSEFLSTQTIEGRTVVAADIGSHLLPDEIHDRLKRFKAGEVDVLTFTRTLEEGWDDPAASFCINMSPTTSPLKTTQLLGRILRKNTDGRESIFIDMIDQLTGVKKQQYTALHALDIDFNDISRVLGSTSGSGSGMVIEDLGDIFGSDLFNQLLKSSGKTLREIFIQEAAHDPLFDQWERTLTKEGMPKRLDAQYIPDKKLAEYETILSTLTRELGRLPLHAEFMQEIDDLGSADKLKMAEFTALQLYAASRLLGGTVEELGIDDPELDRRHNHEALQQELQAAFMNRALSTKEATIMLRYLGSPEDAGKDSQAKYRAAYNLGATETSRLFRDGPSILKKTIQIARASQIARESAPIRPKIEVPKSTATIADELLALAWKPNEASLKHNLGSGDTSGAFYRYAENYRSVQDYWVRQVMHESGAKILAKALDVESVVARGLVRPTGYFVHAQTKLLTSNEDLASYYNWAVTELDAAFYNMQAIAHKNPKMTLDTALNSTRNTVRERDIQLMFNIDEVICHDALLSHRNRRVLNDAYRSYSTKTLTEIIELAKTANMTARYAELATPTKPFSLRDDRPAIYDWNEALRIRTQEVLKSLDARVSAEKAQLARRLGVVPESQNKRRWPLSAVGKQAQISVLALIRHEVRKTHEIIPNTEFKPLDLTSAEYLTSKYVEPARHRGRGGYRHTS
jgi:superfamily II DNA or RNA helicase